MKGYYKAVLIVLGVGLILRFGKSSNDLLNAGGAGVHTILDSLTL